LPAVEVDRRLASFWFAYDFDQVQRLGEAWYALVLADVGDPVVATAVQQMGDGLYHNASIGLLPDGSAQRHTILENLLAVVDRLSPRS
jgi:hypothetical protein